MDQAGIQTEKEGESVTLDWVGEDVTLSDCHIKVFPDTHSFILSVQTVSQSRLNLSRMTDPMCYFRRILLATNYGLILSINLLCFGEY